jgi:hypothetical protein
MDERVRAIGGLFQLGLWTHFYFDEHCVDATVNELVVGGSVARSLDPDSLLYYTYITSTTPQSSAFTTVTADVTALRSLVQRENEAAHRNYCGYCSLWVYGHLKISAQSSCLTIHGANLSDGNGNCFAVKCLPS